MEFRVSGGYEILCLFVYLFVCFEGLGVIWSLERQWQVNLRELDANKIYIEF